MQTRTGRDRRPARSTPKLRFHAAPPALDSVLGRIVAGTAAAALLLLAFFAVSLFLAAGAVLLAFAIGIGLLKSSADAGRRGAPARGGRSRSAPTIIDAERSPDDGVYRPRD